MARARSFGSEKSGHHAFCLFSWIRLQNVRTELKIINAIQQQSCSTFFMSDFTSGFFCLLGKQSEEQSIAFVFLAVSAKETLVFFMNLVVVVRDLYSY
jgi:hypothetical protein